MDKTTLVTSIISLFGGGLIVYAFEFFGKKGKIYIDSYSLILTHLHTTEYKHFVVVKFDLDIQFINSSGYPKIINNLTANFFDGANLHKLIFYGYTVPPADVIEAKQAQCLQFELVGKDGNFYCPTNSDNFRVDINFNINGKPQNLKIGPDGLQLKDETHGAYVS